MKRKLRHWRQRFKLKIGKPLEWFWYDVKEVVRKAFRKCFHYVKDWWTRRKGRCLLFGMPALLAAIGVGALGVAVAMEVPGELGSYYQRQAARQLVARDYLAARVGYERLARLPDSRPEHLYGLALVLRGLGEQEETAGRKDLAEGRAEQAAARSAEARLFYERARVLLSTAASLDGPGYPPAHIRLAVDLLAQGAPLPPTLDLAERHLLRAVQLQPEALEAHALLGQFYVRTNRPDLAEKHLLVVAENRPEFGLLLAGLYRARGQKDQARIRAERCARLFATQLDDDPANLPARLNLAEAALLTGEYARALTLLQEGLGRSGAPVFRARIAKACLAWLEVLTGDTEKEQGERIQLVELGLRSDPNNLDLLRQLAKVARLDGPQAEQARTMLQSLLAKGKGSFSLHLVLGVDAFERGKTAQALQHLEQAYRLDPNFPVLANNFAWALAQAEPPELERALRIINTVLERHAQDLRFRETRGQILAKMGRWDAAILDLQAALPRLPDDRNLHKSLAEAYRQLGNAEMAAQHQKLADAPPVTPSDRP
ncbi:hypothetical protein AYO44_05360 [Planctomycetaceae bacterium SCGC AG-212-F19]|nr:hypothetical protein AYO44_05360 [Planctomycetaceae bacterium SCGC AG-212-F19]